MKTAFFSTKPYDKRYFEAANGMHKHELRFFEPHLAIETTALAVGYPAICGFVNDQLNATVLRVLAQQGPADTRPANKGDMVQLFEHLEAELEAGGYFRNIAAKRPSMIRNIRNIFQRAELLESDVRTLRGVIRALTGRRAREGRPPRRG